MKSNRIKKHVVDSKLKTEKTRDPAKKKRLGPLFKWITALSLIVIFIVTAYMLTRPYVPEIRYTFFPPEKNIISKLDVSEETRKKLEKEKSEGISTVTAEVNSNTTPNPTPTPQYVLEGNKLVIPAIGLITPILEGSDITVLDRESGVWHEPYDTLPDKPGNFVLAGHRFQYLGPNTETLYFLNRLDVGDTILVRYNNIDYVYEVYLKKEVSPATVEIRNPSPDYENILTLYTCTTMNTNDNRLVIQAKRI